VLNVSGPGSAGIGAAPVAGAESGAVAGWLESAALWQVAARAGSVGVLEPTLSRVPLDQPIGENADVLLLAPLTEPRTTPEPGTLALAGIGLCALALRSCKRSGARLLVLEPALKTRHREVALPGAAAPINSGSDRT
jgi:hypothetical protein